ncbi:hypothetical protein [Halobacillus sp. Marseille-P3879]|uniref:hypothetical protein n=1 Tax=Halobacillus TaxID=45667 RepID=UPI000C7B8546|nr:hypothetical protein [Halobacillus sp. Marseille-P3879]
MNVKVAYFNFVVFIKLHDLPGYERKERGLMTIHFFIYTIDVSVSKKNGKPGRRINKEWEDQLLNRKAAYRNLY